MSTIADLRPGATIHNASRARGTLTCFAINPGKPQRLYGITARHVIPAGQYCWLGDPNDLAPLNIGGPARHGTGLDVLYFRIDDQYRTQLGQGNFRPLGYNADVLGVWDPQKLHAKENAAPTARAAAAHRAKQMTVQHLGGTNVATVSGPVAGMLEKWTANGTTRITHSAVAPGDSGGPVIDPAKHRYVGFISTGQSHHGADTGDVVVLHDALQRLGLALATWQNRNHWQ